MKIFITGSRGFIARNLSEYYHDHEQLLHDKGQDITSALNSFRPDLILHCGAEIYQPELMWDSNILLLKNILDYVRQNNTELIHIGSSSEYGKVTRAAKETDRINPVDMYQATKGAGTILCQGYAQQYKLPITIARAYSVYGKYEKPHRLFPRLWKAFQLDQPMKLFQGYHDFIFIDDFVRGIDILVKEKDKHGDIVNLGSGIQYSNTEILAMFESITNKQAPVEYVETMAKTFESEVWLCDTSYAFEKYGFKCEYSIEQGIAKFLKTADYPRE
jgi:UDP-glucuronate 4-epimerase